MRRMRLYFRMDCHLCEDMQSHLEELRRAWHFELELIDVDAATQVIREGYQQRVPLLEAVDGLCLSEYYLDEVTVLSYLQGA